MNSFADFLNQIPPTAWTAVGTAILTSTVAFLGIFYTNHTNTKRAILQHEHEKSIRRDEIIRDRAEENDKKGSRQKGVKP